MRTLVLSSLLALMVCLALAADASAFFRPRPERPWCAFYSEGFDECFFASEAQCRASVSGVGGYCYRNLRWVEPPPPVRKKRAKRKREY